MVASFESFEMAAPRSPELRPILQWPDLAAAPSARLSTAHSSSTAGSQEREAASLCPDLQSGREFRDTTYLRTSAGIANGQISHD